jgi:hypothetical protein
MINRRGLVVPRCMQNFFSLSFECGLKRLQKSRYMCLGIRHRRFRHATPARPILFLTDLQYFGKVFLSKGTGKKDCACIIKHTVQVHTFIQSCMTFLSKRERTVQHGAFFVPISSSHQFTRGYYSSFRQSIKPSNHHCIVPSQIL